MKRIGLLSDTHGFLDEPLLDFLADCDEIWHAGDIGDPMVTDTLAGINTLRAVHGNIDGPELRHRYPQDLIFEVEGVKVLMTHIGGYPGKYQPRVRALLDREQPLLYICGHSHILKVMPDPKRQLLHINPGAAGMSGFHKKRTAVRFTIGGPEKISRLQVWELGKGPKGRMMHI